MQKHFPLHTCLFLALLLAGHRAVAQQVFAPRDLPQLYYLLYWDANSSAYDTTFRFICDYDINGRLLRKEQHILLTPGNWENYLLTEARYTQQPDSNISSTYYWDGSNWVQYSRKILITDSLGRTTHELNYQGSTAWVLQSGSRFTYVHDLSGRLEDVLLEDYDLPNSVWDTTQLTHFVYGAASTPEIINYDVYSNGLWYPDSRDIDVQWQNFSRFKANYYVRQILFNNQYYNSERVNCSFGPFDYRRCSTDVWDGNIWGPEEREKHLQDAYGHLTDVGRELYDGPGWVISSWVHYTHTYNGGKLSESIEQGWNMATQQLNNLSKYVFFDHAVEVAPPAEGRPLIAFPQPARDRLYVRCDLRGALRMRLHDLQGRLLLDEGSDAIRLVESGLDISQVPAGLYLLQIEAAQRVHTVRIHVQH